MEEKNKSPKHRPEPPRFKKKCQYCGNQFLARRSTGEYCSVSCKKKMYYLREKRQKEKVKTYATEEKKMVLIRIKKYIPVFEYLRPNIGSVYSAEQHGGTYGVMRFFIIPDIEGKRIVVRDDECEIV